MCPWRSEERVLDPQEVELWIVFNNHVCAGNQTQVLWRNNKQSPPWKALLIKVLCSHFTTGDFPTTAAFLSACLPVKPTLTSIHLLDSSVTYGFPDVHSWSLGQ